MSFPDLIRQKSLRPEQIAPLESLCQGWPEVWREFARSAFVTLRVSQLPDGIDLEQLAVQLALGIVKDFKGTKLYIPCHQDSGEWEYLAPMQELALQPLCQGWPEVWRQYARTVYATLQGCALPTTVDPAQLAVLLVQGIVEDLGYSQPYIPIGKDVRRQERLMQMLDLLKRGHDYRHAASAVGMAERTARRAEVQYLKVLRLLSRGHTHAEVARQERISEACVRDMQALAVRREDRQPTTNATVDPAHTFMAQASPVNPPRGRGRPPRAKPAQASPSAALASPPTVPEAHWPFPHLFTSDPS